MLLPTRDRMLADRQDAVVVNAAVIDAAGVIVPTASNELRFSVRGPAKIIGVGNGNPTSHEADKAKKRKAFNGLCQVILQAGDAAGNVTLTARSDRLKSTTLALSTRRAKRLGFVPSVSPENLKVDRSMPGAWIP